MFLHKKSVVANKVHCENETRKVLNKIAPLVVEQLRQFDGLKIIKADCELVKKFSDKIGFLQEMRDKTKVKPLEGHKHASLHCVYVTCTRYSIRLEISLSFQCSEHGCEYSKGTVYVGDIKNSLMGDYGDGTLEKVHEYEPRKVLSVPTQWKKYEQAAKAKEKAEYAVTTMWYGLRDLVR